MTCWRSQIDLKKHRNMQWIVVCEYFQVPKVEQRWLKFRKTNFNFNQIIWTITTKKCVVLSYYFWMQHLTHVEQRSIWLNSELLELVPWFSRSAFNSGTSLSPSHPTDLDHVFVCRGALDSVRDVGDRGVYANGYHLQGDGHGFSSEDSSVQYLRVLQTEKKAVISIQVQ